MLELIRIAAATALIPLALQAQGSATRYGKACRANTNVCQTKNTQFTTATQQPPAGWVQLRVDVPAGTTLNVSGFSLLLRSLTGSSQRVQTRLYAGTAAGPTSVLHDGTEVFVDTTQAWCSTWFPETQFSGGQIFYIAYRNPGSGNPGQVSLGGAPSSVGVQVQWHVGGTRQANAFWKLRILCDGATPNMQYSGSPSIGQILNLRVDNVPGGASGSAFVLFGVPVVPPVDLSQIGAPQCDLNCTPSLWFIGQPGSVWTFPLSIPNAPALRGLRFCAQWLVAAPGTNAGGFTSSEGLDIVIG